MSEGAATAGALLRAAREKQGLHIAALAAAIKVTPRKLEALEGDRYAELPDPAFTRALAQTVCRQLKIDAQPVLALLPHSDTAAALDHVTGSLNTPFRERANRGDPVGLAAAAVRPMVGAGLLLVVAAIVVYLMPPDFWRRAPALPEPSLPPAASAPQATASVAAAPASAPDLQASAPAAETVLTAPPGEPAAPAVEAPKLVQLLADRASWVEARDGRGQVLFSRVIQRGESVEFDGVLPIRLTIGNAGATQLTFRGTPVDLAPRTRDNVARLELQ